jgi:UDP-N-acetylglucosamine acyltransferase
VIKSGTIIHGACTIDGGYMYPTVIGRNCYIMKQVHIGHDATLGDEVTIAPHATIGGHCILENRVGIGMNASVHQFVNVKEDCFLGQGCILPRGFQTEANTKYVGVGKSIGKNR